ncbi:MAG: ABC transporter permease [Bacteroidetes bacterium]|nr:MAG: ABC transporter permease [Bacteroidota bacterium]
MNFSFYIAKRYLFSKKTHNIINIISGISAIGVTIGTMALIIVLSVFNGFENLVESLFNTFNPDIKITAKHGKTFNKYDIPVDSIKKIPGVAYYTDIIEENVLLKYNNKQDIVTIKGVDNDFEKMTKIDSAVVEGIFILKNNNNNFTVLGYGIAYYLGINLNDIITPLSVYAPKRGETSALNINNAFNYKNIYPSGFFSIQQDFDEKYMIVPIRFAKQLLNYKNEITSVEIGLDKYCDKKDIQEKIQALTGDKYYVKNRFQQQEMLYKIMKSEKFAIFLILSFILLIATFNIIGSLSMLILDKKEDITVLKSMGANNKLIKKIFLYEGMLISITGAIFGLIIGIFICYLQQKFGIIKLSSEGSSFVVDTYPVFVKISDIVIVFLTVCIIGFSSVWLPVKNISKKYLDIKLS